MGKISIHSLQIATTIGQYAFERTAPQCIVVDLDYWTNTEGAEIDDTISGTVDYAAVCLAIREFASRSHFQLLEALARGIMTDLLAQFPIQELVIRLTKSGCVPSAAAVSVELNWKS
ncbi:dihydroneopterin aldolase [bacterium]|nr:dihydroneopterin aldolase [bacterium]